VSGHSVSNQPLLSSKGIDISLGQAVVPFLFRPPGLTFFKLSPLNSVTPLDVCKNLFSVKSTYIIDQLMFFKCCDSLLIVHIRYTPFGCVQKSLLPLDVGQKPSLHKISDIIDQFRTLDVDKKLNIYSTHQV